VSLLKIIGEDKDNPASGPIQKIKAGGKVLLRLYVFSENFFSSPLIILFSRTIYPPIDLRCG